MSEKFGYIGSEDKIPQQAFLDLKGIFDLDDIRSLDQENKWTNFGQLELISTIDISTNTANLDFTNIKGTDYQVHLVTINNLKVASDSAYYIEMQFSEGGTFMGASKYEYANRYWGSSYGEYKHQGYNYFRSFGYADANYPQNAYCYLYNLSGASRYSFGTWHTCLNEQNASYKYGYFGSGTYDKESEVDGIRIRNSGGQNFSSGQVSLYGLRFA